ncbi:MAG: hypothetical protein LBG81_03745 [Coriobacteriaceae bacterium]|jgi:uncharacterized protein YjdB|nr:hypothetical protein [Coriobacteriaceae bacterium]
MTTEATITQLRRLEAFELSPTMNTTGKTLYYQVHIAGFGWTQPVAAGYTAGTIGVERAIEAIRIWLQ